MSKKTMTIEKWLSDVYQDTYVGNKIWNKKTDGGSEMIADIRGWGAIQYLFKNNEEAKQFQNEVCKFIVEAIREKVERTYGNNEGGMSEKPTNQIEKSEKPINLKEISDEEIEAFAMGYYNEDGGSHYVKIGIEWYREQLK